MSEKDDAAAAYYSDPAHRMSDSLGHGLPGRPERLSSHVPVRFDRSTIAAIKQFSDEDGMSVSAWVRRVVDKEVQRRISLMTGTATSWGARISLQLPGQAAPATATLSVGVLSDLRPVA